MKRKTTYFTLKEFFVAILFIGGFLFAVTPNITNSQPQNIKSDTLKNLSKIQEIEDKYGLEKYEIIKKEENVNSFRIDYDTLHEKYIFDLPKTEGVYYWIGSHKNVWASTTKYPVNVVNNGTKLTWSSDYDTISFRIYEVTEAEPKNTEQKIAKKKSVENKQEEEDIVKKSVKQEISKETKKKLKLVKETFTNTFPTGNEKTYYVTSIDKYGLESVPTKSVFNKEEPKREVNKEKVVKKIEGGDNSRKENITEGKK